MSFGSRRRKSCLKKTYGQGEKRGSHMSFGSLATFSLSNGNLFEVLFGVAGIISQFGGELDLQSTIADGADICKIRFRRPNVDVEPKVKKVK